jgi:SAM-dependent methyltransferase
MRLVTRRAAGLASEGWTTELRDETERYFDALSEDWHTRVSPERTAVVIDALERGLGAAAAPRGLAVEVGSGIGTYSPLFAERFGSVLAVDLSLPMLVRSPAGPARRVRADGASLPVRSASAVAVALVNAFLFPAEVARLLAPGGLVLWVNSSGAETPIHLTPEEVAASLPGAWSGVASQAGDGLWCVLRRDDSPAGR